MDASPQWLTQDDFALFGLPQQFAVDGAELEARYQTLQRLAHPDRFAASGASASRVATQLSARLNEAVRRLRDPFLRAQYLCALRGAPVQDDTLTNSPQAALPAAFLQEQMQWHEDIDECTDAASLQPLFQALQARTQDLLTQATQVIDRDVQEASRLLRQLVFFQRLHRNAEHKLQALQTS